MTEGITRLSPLPAPAVAWLTKRPRQTEPASGPAPVTLTRAHPEVARSEACAPAGCPQFRGSVCEVTRVDEAVPVANDRARCSRTPPRRASPGQPARPSRRNGNHARPSSIALRGAPSGADLPTNRIRTAHRPRPDADGGHRIRAGAARLPRTLPTTCTNHRWRQMHGPVPPSADGRFRPLPSPWCAGSGPGMHSRKHFPVQGRQAVPTPVPDPGPPPGSGPVHWCMIIPAPVPRARTLPRCGDGCDRAPPGRHRAAAPANLRRWSGPPSASTPPGVPNGACIRGRGDAPPG